MPVEQNVSAVAFPQELLPEKTAFECMPLEAIENAPARRAIEIWTSLRGSRRFPSRSDLKPRDIAPIMQNMSIVKVLDGGKDFENGFVGDAVVRAHDIPIVHRRFSDLSWDMPGLMAQLTPLFESVVKSGEPLAYRGKTGHDLTGVVYTDFEGVLLPLGEGAVDHIVYVGICLRQVSHVYGQTAV